MRKAVESGVSRCLYFSYEKHLISQNPSLPQGFGSGFPDEVVKCPEGGDGKNNAISNYACYFSTVTGGPILSDPLKEDGDGSVGSCKGYTSASPLETFSVA